MYLKKAKLCNCKFNIIFTSIKIFVIKFLVQLFIGSKIILKYFSSLPQIINYVLFIWNIRLEICYGTFWCLKVGKYIFSFELLEDEFIKNSCSSVCKLWLIILLSHTIAKKISLDKYDKIVTILSFNSWKMAIIMYPETMLHKVPH